MGVNITLPRLPKTLLGLRITNVARDALGPNKVEGSDPGVKVAM